ncbi:MAG: Gfo/Idh/MocA family protein, partial [Myxococcota bacterium]
MPLLLREPELGSIVAVAEPDPERRAIFAKRFGLARDACFTDSGELLEEPRLADFALIATQDQDHVEPTLAALERGYDVLLEKPMALDEGDCERLVEA